MYFWYFHSMKHLNCHSTSFLIGVRRALLARSQREKGDRCVWVKYPMSQAISGKANLYSLMYAPPSSLTVLKGSKISQQIGHLLGEGKMQAHKGQVSSPRSPFTIARNILSPDDEDTTSSVTFTPWISPKFSRVCPVAIYPRTMWIPPLCDSRGLCSL